jgi:hypothetical protein
LTFEAEIHEIYLAEQGADGSLWQVLLSRTDFAEGQTGTLTARSASGRELEIAVLRVHRSADGRVWHDVAKPLSPGTRVTGRVGGAD